MRKDNLPAAALENIPPAAVVEMVGGIQRLRKMPRPKSDDEVRQRIDDYFELCLDTGMRPGVESLALAIGIDRTTLFRWAHGLGGCSRERQEMAAQAKQAVITYIEQAQLTGRLNPVSSLFMLKNWAGYKDKYEFEGLHRNELRADMTPDEIAAEIGFDLEKIKRDIPIDADYEVDGG